MAKGIFSYSCKKAYEYAQQARNSCIHSLECAKIAKEKKLIEIENPQSMEKEIKFSEDFERLAIKFAIQSNACVEKAEKFLKIAEKNVRNERNISTYNIVSIYVQNVKKSARKVRKYVK